MNTRTKYKPLVGWQPTATLAMTREPESYGRSVLVLGLRDRLRTLKDQLELAIRYTPNENMAELRELFALSHTLTTAADRMENGYHHLLGLAAYRNLTRE